MNAIFATQYGLPLGDGDDCINVDLFAGGGVSEHLSEAHRQGVLLSQRYGQDMDDYQRKHRLNHYRDVA